MDEKVILKELNEIKTKITTIEIVLIGVTDAPGLCGIVKEHGTQIAKLNSWRFQVIGGVIVIVAIAGYILKYVL
jgi:hypothetical protein